jgi:phospholipid/cholesterol/gamma-HCH transport system permease protein
VALDDALLDREPRARIDHSGFGLHATLSGRWTADQAPAVERAMAELLTAAVSDKQVVLDLAGIERLDTLGAWVLDRTRHELAEQDRSADFVGARSEHRILLDEIAYRRSEPVPPPPSRSGFVDCLADVGHAVVGAGRDFGGGIAFLGEVIVALGRVVAHPGRFRGPALIHQLEQIAFRGVPIIVLISFLVGCIVAQQGIFQLQRFGATPFVVNLIGILVLRELGVLLTSIMVSGRSGSAFTAEIGSMKMREEVDALRVMGLDPIEILIVPRLIALMLALPILTFLADLASLLGAGLVTWIYGSITPGTFVTRLQSVVGLKQFSVGLIKAPFMALVIGVIASIEGFAVEGSAESLGRHVTSSVVKGIFMVIVLDGLFAVFFAAISY